MIQSAALFRASNLRILDYPFDAALVSALNVCDEAVVVIHADCQDDTLEWLWDLQTRYAGRVKVRLERWRWDRIWQERTWDWAVEMTDAEWLMFHDADEAIHEDDAPAVRALMAGPEVSLIRFPFVHLYATPHYHMARGFLTHNTRLGRRSVGYRMRNWCSDEHPRHAACQMVFGPDERNAHIPREGVGLVTVDVPILHYGWCRSARALAVSQTKLRAWYADGSGLEDGRIPQVKPRDFALTEMIANGRVERYESRHPAAMESWFGTHREEWRALEEAVSAC